MIKFVENGNLIAETTEAIVNTVNCVGVMGRGVALQFKNKYPENYKLYQAACKRQAVVPGKMFIVPNGLIPPRWIINFPTKRHWRQPSRYDDVEQGLDDLVRQVRLLGIKSLALPPLGCGLGGLDWGVVRELIVSKLSELTDVSIRVYEPNNSVVRTTSDPRAPRMTEGRAVLLVLSERYIREASIDADFTLIALHKLMYFMQSDGYDLKLRYQRAAAGPYAQNLKNVLNHIEGHFITGYNDGGDNPMKVLNVLDGPLMRAKEFLRNCTTDVAGHIDRVLTLVGPQGDDAFLELLSTVHWLYHREEAKTIDVIRQKMWDWGERKRRYSSVQIDYAFNRLMEQGWLSL